MHFTALEGLLLLAGGGWLVFRLKSVSQSVYLKLKEELYPEAPSSRPSKH